MYRQETNDFSGLIENGTVRPCNGDKSPVLCFVDKFPCDRATGQQGLPEMLILFVRHNTGLKNTRGFAYRFFGREAIYLFKSWIGVLNGAFPIGDNNRLI